MIFNWKIDTNLSIKVTNTDNDLKEIIMTLKLNTRLYLVRGQQKL
jgi:hypothetical protein